MDIYEFYSGRSFDAYRELGAHVKKEVTGKKTVVWNLSHMHRMLWG